MTTEALTELREFLAQQKSRAGDCDIGSDENMANAHLAYVQYGRWRDALDAVTTELETARADGERRALVGDDKPSRFYREKPQLRPESYLTLSQFQRLSWACVPLRAAWGSPYLVGSVLRRPDYRDVDLRLIVDDDIFAAMFDDRDGRIGRRRGSLSLLVVNCTISDWLAIQTGLPIDFQFQTFTEAQTYDGLRNPLGVLGVDHA